MICAPITASGNSQALSLLARAKQEGVDISELRLDYFREAVDLPKLLAATGSNVIVTVRSERQGGMYRESEEKRLALVQAAVDAGVDFVDIEADSVGKIRPNGKTNIIASWHNFKETPDDLSRQVGEMAALPCDWVKFAVMANRQADNLAVFSAISSCPKPVIGLAMGQIGLPSRVLALSRGSRLTFGSLAPEYESAPGQPTVRELSDLYRVKNIGAKTAIYGLIGNPVAQSRGYRAHNAAFTELGLDAVYIPFQTDDPAWFLDVMADKLGIRGLSVTVPFKLDALALAGSASAEARAIGAANTLTRDGSTREWRAENTDAPAAAEIIRLELATLGKSLDGAKALLLGAGGAARAVGMAAEDLGCDIAVAARDYEKAVKMAADMGWNAIPMPEAVAGRWDMVMNATPVGMFPNVDDTPFPASGWKKGMIAFDAIANPKITRFLGEAAAAGAHIVTGSDMFLAQAAMQFRLWTGTAAPAGVMAAAVGGVEER